MSSQGALKFVRSFIKISEMVSNLQSGRYYLVEIAIFNIYDVQRAVSPKVGKPELWFLCSARRLLVLYVCVRLHEIISNGFQLTEQK